MTQPDSLSWHDRLSSSVAETEAIAADLATHLFPGAVLALHGEMGAGKTQFVRGLARGLGADPAAVSSPTFTLLNIYPAGRLTLYHLDAYRVAGPEDFETIGFGELLEQGGVVVVEWPTRVASLLPPTTLHLELLAGAVHQRHIRRVSP